MAAALGMAGSCGSPTSSSSWVGGGFLNGKRRRGSTTVCLVTPCSASLTDQYRTLRINPGASEKEVKKAFRHLALQYHPDVCKGSNCGVQFSRINEAYDIVMSNLRQSEEEVPQSQEWSEDGYGDEEMRGMYDPTWDLWEEWMGWEGAGIRDYSSHINPYT